MENISRKEREGHKYVPGTANEVERQHVNEHETLQLLQRHALNGKHKEFFNLLTNTITEKHKQQEFIMICGMKDFNNEN